MKLARVEESRAAPAEHPEYFGGRVRMQPLEQPDPNGTDPELIAVFFDTGARTKPHVHHCAQVLHVVSGRCVVATEHEQQVAEPGDLVIVPAGIWHWHGATVDGPMCHISVKLPGRTDWGVPLKDW